jgi:hypothetical protein
MKRVKVPVLIEYHKVPRRYRLLLQQLQRGRWTRAELRWIQRQHPDLPPVVAAVVRQMVYPRIVSTDLDGLTCKISFPSPMRGA